MFEIGILILYILFRNVYKIIIRPFRPKRKINFVEKIKLDF